MKHGPSAPCPCGSGLSYPQCCAAGIAADPLRQATEEDCRWVEAHIIRDGDLLLYGSLLQELVDVPPATLWREFRRIGEAYLADGPERTRRLHARVDATIDALIERDQRFGYAPPFCHKGCAKCCHELVYCTDEEAAGIRDYCQEKGLVIDLPKLRRQLQHIDFDAHSDHTGGTTWNDQPQADQSCVFLDPTDQACRIWPVRPLVCRVHLAQGTDQYCAPHNGLENPEAQGINYIEMSYILSVVFTLHRDSIKRTLGRLLLEASPGEPR